MQNRKGTGETSYIFISFNINVATNVAKTYLTLIDKHFPQEQKAKKNLQ